MEEIEIEELRAFRRAIGIRIKEARIAQGLTSTQLSELSGIPQSAISRIENGRLNAKINTYWAIAHALDLNLGVVTD